MGKIIVKLSKDQLFNHFFWGQRHVNHKTFRLMGERMMTKKLKREKRNIHFHQSIKSSIAYNLCLKNEDTLIH
mgnify:CR=1 FL=1|jgi:hypothetical protein